MLGQILRYLGKRKSLVRLARPATHNGLSLSQQFQRLESRELLAGDVQAFFSGADLMIFGDRLDNQILISVVDGDIRLTGQNGTTINRAGSFTIRNDSTTFSGNVIGSLGDGNDRWVMQGSTEWSRHVAVFMGSGNDLISIEDAQFAQQLSLITDSGDDQIAVQDATVSGILFVETGSGADTVSINRITVNGTSRIKLGKGDDVVQLSNSTFSQFVSPETNSGNDTVILANTNFNGGVHTSLGRGNDVMTHRDVQINGGSQIDGQQGNDSIRYEDTESIPDQLTINGGKGNNAANVTSVNTNSQQRSIQRVQSTNLDDSLFAARLTAPETGAADRLAAAQQFLNNDPDFPPLGLIAGFRSTQTVQSSGVLLTKLSSLDISGQTEAGALVEISRDGDGLFDDGFVTADANGNYTLTVDSIETSRNNGINVIVVRATDSENRTATQTLEVYRAAGTVVRFNSSAGRMDFELFDTDAPNTVENFLNYEARYQNSIVHRSAKTTQGGDFVIQGGGFRINDSDDLVAIATDAPVASEANSGNSNVRGTLAMALLGGEPNSGTSQWFVNLANNTFLDSQSFTVFGRVIGSGLDVADAIAALSRFDVSDLLGSTTFSALNEAPLTGYTEFSGSTLGTVSLTNGSNVITGTGTTFTTDIPDDNRIRIGGQTFTVSQIVSDTELRVTTNSNTTVSGVRLLVNQIPTSSQYVTMTTIAPLSVPS